MAKWFPSREWLEAYQAALNDNEVYREVSEGWGVDFAGDFVFEITDVPVTETTVGDLPADLTGTLWENIETLDGPRLASLLADVPPALGDRLSECEGSDRKRLINALSSTPLENTPAVMFPALREEYPADLENLLDQLEKYVRDDTIYAYIDLRDGKCRETTVLEDPRSRDPGFGLSGSYTHWKDLLEGADVMESIFSQDLELDGSTTTILPYNEAAEELGDTAGRLDSRYLF